MLSSITTYWGQLFIIPKKVIKEVECVCRNFLWTGLDGKSQKSPIAWENVCKPFKYGGHNIRRLALWNIYNSCPQATVDSS